MNTNNKNKTASDQSESTSSVNIYLKERDRQVCHKDGEHREDNFRINIQVGDQSFELAYEADTLEAAEWYANQTYNALSSAGISVSIRSHDY